MVSLGALGPFMLVTGTVNDWGRPIDDSRIAGMFPLVCALTESAVFAVNISPDSTRAGQPRQSLQHRAGFWAKLLHDKNPCLRCQHDRGL